MSIQSKNLLVKLDAPSNGQSYFGEKVDLKFWISNPNQTKLMDKDELEYEVIYQEVKPTLSSAYLGTTTETLIYSSLKTHSPNSQFQVRFLSFITGTNYLFPDTQIDSPVLSVNACIHRKMQTKGTFVFKIKVLFQGTYYTSNTASITFTSPQEFSGQILGGPITNLPDFTVGNSVVAKGWALEIGSEIESIEAIVPFASKIFVQQDLSKKYPLNSLPDLDEAQGASIDVVSLFEPGLENELVSINVRVKFKSGSEKDFYWGATRVNTTVQSGFIFKSITEEGRWLRFEGYLFSPDTTTPKFYLQSSRTLKEINPDYISISNNEDNLNRLDSSYISSSGSSKVSFLLPNDFLGSNPGSIKLGITNKGEELTIYGNHVSEKMSLAFNQSSQDKGIFPHSKAFHFLGSKGLLPVKSLKKMECSKKQVNSDNNILFTSHNLSLTEGAPKVIFSILEYLSQYFSTSILSFKQGEALNILADKVKSTNILTELDQSGLDFERFKSGIIKANTILLQENPNIVLANGLDSFPLVCASIDQSIKTLWIIHESINPAHWYQHLPIPIRNRFLFALKNSDRIVFVAPQTKELFLPFIKEESCRVIRNGFDISKFQSELKNIDTELEKSILDIQPNEYVFLTVGTTTERKGQDRTIRELAILKKAMPEFKFRMLFVGARELPYLSSLRQLTLSLGLRDNIIFIPETKNVIRYYAIANCFIINSREESSPLVALEALASNIPLVSTTVYGLADLIIDGQNALAFDGDSEGDLSSTLQKVILNSKETKELVNRGNDFIKDTFTIERMGLEYKKLIDELS